MPALDIAVHDVVVQQREVVHEFDGDRRRHAITGVAATRFGRQHGEGRPDRFAPDAVAHDRLTVGVEPAQVVGRDLAHVLAVEPVDGGSESGDDEGARAGQNRRRLDGVMNELGATLDDKIGA